MADGSDWWVEPTLYGIQTTTPAHWTSENEQFGMDSRSKSNGCFWVLDAWTWFCFSRGGINGQSFSVGKHKRNCTQIDIFVTPMVVSWRDTECLYFHTESNAGLDMFWRVSCQILLHQHNRKCHGGCTSPKVLGTYCTDQKVAFGRCGCQRGLTGWVFADFHKELQDDWGNAYDHQVHSLLSVHWMRGEMLGKLSEMGVIEQASELFVPFQKVDVRSVTSSDAIRTEHTDICTGEKRTKSIRAIVTDIRDSNVING